MRTFLDSSAFAKRYVEEPLVSADKKQVAAAKRAGLPARLV